MNWRKTEYQKEWFLAKSLFITNISERVDARLERLGDLNLIDLEQQESFYTLFTSFLGKLLSGFSEYMPLRHEVIQLVDFVELKGENHEIECKILKFNDIFGIVSKEDKPSLIEEINALLNMNLTKEIATAKGSSLHL